MLLIHTDAPTPFFFFFKFLRVRCSFQFQSHLMTFFLFTVGSDLVALAQPSCLVLFFFFFLMLLNRVTLLRSLRSSLLQCDYELHSCISRCVKLHCCFSLFLTWPVWSLINLHNQPHMGSFSSPSFPYFCCFFLFSLLLFLTCTNQ